MWVLVHLRPSISQGDKSYLVGSGNKKCERFLVAHGLVETIPNKPHVVCLELWPSVFCFSVVEFGVVRILPFGF